MAVHDLFELAAMLRVQLPFLFSFAVMRWMLGVAFGGVGGWTVRRLGGSCYLPSIVNTLKRLRASMYAVSLVGLTCAWAQDTAWSGVPHACAAHVSARVQGLASGVGMLVLVTSGNSLALGLALATLKAVADMSASSIMLASVAVLFAVRCGRGVGSAISLLSGVLASFVIGCWRGSHGQKYTEAPVMALVVMAMFVLGRATTLLVLSVLRSGTQWTRTLLRVPSGVGAWMLALLWRKRCRDE